MFFTTVFVDLIAAVGVSIVMASLLIVYRITKESEISLNDKIQLLKLNKTHVQDKVEFYPSMSEASYSLS